MTARVPHSAKCTKDIYIGNADPNANVRFHIVGNVRNKEWLEQKLVEVSTPSHPNYGKHLTQEELSSATAPNKEDIDKICSVLDSHSIKYERREGDVQATSTVKQAEDLFKTKLHKFTLPENDESTNDFIIHRSGSFTVPSEIASVVSIVTGI